MIILDTSVISELTRQIPEPGVISWLDSLPAGQAGTTAVTAAERRYGVARMPAGRRQTELAAAVRGLLGDEFRDRVLPFGEHCASRYADIVRGRETRTRNTDDFSGTGIELINPWKLDDQSPHDAAAGSGPGPSPGRAGLTRARTGLGTTGLDRVARAGPDQARL